MDEWYKRDKELVSIDYFAPLTFPRYVPNDVFDPDEYRGNDTGDPIYGYINLRYGIITNISLSNQSSLYRLYVSGGRIEYINDYILNEQRNLEINHLGNEISKSLKILIHLYSFQYYPNNLLTMF